MDWVVRREALQVFDDGASDSSHQVSLVMFMFLLSLFSLPFFTLILACKEIYFKRNEMSFLLKSRVKRVKLHQLSLNFNSYRLWMEFVSGHLSLHCAKTNKGARLSVQSSSVVGLSHVA